MTAGDTRVTLKVEIQSGSVEDELFTLNEMRIGDVCILVVSGNGWSSPPGTVIVKGSQECILLGDNLWCAGNERVVITNP